MQCPRCGHSQPDSTECIRCGIVVAKYVARRAAQNGGSQPALASQGRSAQRNQGRAAPEGGSQSAPHSRGKPAPDIGRGHSSDAVLAERGAKVRGAVTLLARGVSGLPPRLFPLSGPRQRFFHSLARMVSSGIPLMDGLSTIEANSSGVVRRLAAAGRSGLEQGLGLSEALATQRKLLTPVALALIEAGEQTGDLVAMLDELARIEEEKDNQLRGLLVGLTYPFTVLVLSCVIMPLPELVMSGTRGYLLALGGNLLTLAGAVVALWFALAFAGPALGPLLARLPGHVERFLFPSRAGLFFLVIGACIRTGMSIVQALELAGDVFHSTANRQHLRQAAESVREGQKLADALAWLCRAQDRLLVVAGEQAGTMDRAFADLARMHLQRATRRRRVVTAVASVLLALAVVGWIASSVVSSYQRQVEAPMQELEREMNREMRGIWNNL